MLKGMEEAYRRAESGAHEVLYRHDKGGLAAPSATVHGGQITFEEFEARQFFRTFKLGPKIGQCGVAKVFVAEVKGAPAGSKTFAVKRVRKWGLKEQRKEAFLEEVRILRHLHHPNVVDICQVYKNDPTYYYMVLEHMAGGELFDRVVNKKTYNEAVARDICVAIVSALKYVHDHGVVHRDLKPANVMLADPADDSSVRLDGFDMACSVSSGHVTTRIQTAEFVAPEILLGKPHGASVDMWSLGVMVYILMVGDHPFYHKDTTKMFLRIAAADCEFRARDWHSSSGEAQDFVRKLLVVDADKRMTAADAMIHPWLLATDQELADRDLGRNLDQFRLYQAKRKLRIAIQTFAAARRMFSDMPGGDDFDTAYTVGEKLGEGAYAEVFVCKPTVAPPAQEPQVYAVKRLKRDAMTEEDEQSVLDEVRILRDLKSPQVVRIFHFFDNDPKYYFMVLELMEGGELFDRIVEKTFYNEEEARDLCRIFLGAVKYIHDQGIVHRDLKPENLLLGSKTDDSTIRLADFGFASSVLDGPLQDQCGTPAYVAPEIIRGNLYTTTPDMWSSGVIVYIILCGYPPFHDQDQTRLFRKIKAGHFKFDDRYWSGVSEDAKDLIRKLLNVHPDKRLTASEAVEHPWLARKGEDLARHDLGSGLKQLRIFNATRKLRAAIQSVVVAKKIAHKLGIEYAA